MHLKELVLSLILLTQVFGPLSAQVADSPGQPDSPGILQRMADRAREARDKVQSVGGTVLDYTRAYYEDHIQPLTNSLNEWASGVKESALETIQTTIENYNPLKH